MAQWQNEPAEWSADDKTLTLQTLSQTDFWRITHSGTITDNGHFYHETRSGAFQLDVKFSGTYNTLYDQAGLMVRVDEKTWLKCGIEYIDGQQCASCVVTRDFSDWSMVALPSNPPALWLRLSRQDITYEVSYSLDGSVYQLLRQAYLSPAETVEAGIMAASPLGSGFSVTFAYLNV